MQNKDLFEPSFMMGSFCIQKLRLILSPSYKFILVEWFSNVTQVRQEERLLLKLILNVPLKTVIGCIKQNKTVIDRFINLY